MSNYSDKISVEERARKYVAAMPPSVSGSGGHEALFNCVRALIHGFGFTPHEARPFVNDFNGRCDPAWSEGEINHKLRSVDGLNAKFPRGYLRRENDWKPSAAMRRDHGIPTETEVKQKVEFDAEKLKRIAAPWRDAVTSLWLANRSAVDPATLGAGDFLRLLYPNGEKILVFQNEYSQGDCLWPDEVDKLPTEGKCGVWYLPQPVSGAYVPNPEGKARADGKPAESRRTWRAVTAFRYMVLESDVADARDWLGFIVQAPLQIEALYTSGAPAGGLPRSIHALVRVDCKTKEQWDEEKRRMMPFLMGGLICGADRGTWSAVRLSRLPGCIRYGKMEQEKLSGFKAYKRYPEQEGRLQKLLYFRPGAQLRPICELPAVRDVAADWCAAASAGVSDADEQAAQTLAWLRRGLGHHAGASKEIRAALGKLNAEGGA